MKWLREEREKIIRREARETIRIQDYGDDICYTIDGIKAMSITGDVAKDIETLKRMRNDYITAHTQGY